MIDAAIYQTDLGSWRLSIANGTLALDDSPRSAVIVSLYTDRRANPDDELPDNSGYMGGNWNDDYPHDGSSPSPQIRPKGSRLWLLRRAKQTNETRLRAIEYAKEALQWMIESGRATEIIIDAEWQRRGFLVMHISITLRDGTEWAEQFPFMLEAA